MIHSLYTLAITLMKRYSNPRDVVPLILHPRRSTQAAGTRRIQSAFPLGSSFAALNLAYNGMCSHSTGCIFEGMCITHRAIMWEVKLYSSFAFNDPVFHGWSKIGESLHEGVQAENVWGCLCLREM